MKEKIVPAVNLPGFLVSNIGRVWRPHGEGVALVKQSPHSAGYRVFTVRFKEKGITKAKQIYVHHVVLESFVGPCPPGMECRHLDDNPSNNRLSNLCWGTASENHLDRTRNGKGNRGSRHGMAKIDEPKAIRIRLMKSQGFTTRAVAEEFGISEWSVKNIVLRKTWKHV